MIQIMKNALSVLLHSWGAVQHAVIFNNLAQDNIHLVNAAQVEIDQRITKVLRRITSQ